MKTFLGKKSVTLRLTLMFAAVSSSVLLLLGLAIGALAEQHFKELDLDLLGGKLELVRSDLATVSSQADLEALPKRLDAALVGHHGLWVRIRSADGKLIYVSEDARFPEWREEAPASEGSFLLNTDDGRHWRVLSGRANLGFAQSVVSVWVDLATDLTHHESFMASFRSALWATVAMAALASGLLGWAAARRGMAPLTDISRDVAAVTASRLDRRLPVEAIPVELAEVAHTLNDMLARLEDSFHKLSDFSSDLAHELRTPVSNLLTQTQVTLSKERRSEEYQNVLASNAEELERLSRTIADMLFLAKAENALVVPNAEPVDLRAEVEGILEFYEALAEENELRLRVVGHATACGDRLMLRRAISNLLSNAFRHTPNQGSISVLLRDAVDGMVELEVRNTGASIPPEHLSRLFDRFYRADPSRQRDAEGAGLGLAITRSILQAHGGSVAVESKESITSFVIRLSRA